MKSVKFRNVDTGHEWEVKGIESLDDVSCYMSEHRMDEDCYEVYPIGWELEEVK